MRKHSKSQINIITTILNQLVATACGIVVPRILIGGFGSAAYGITVSITQFLSYITLLEGGIGGVARAELYGPLASGDTMAVSAVYQAEKSFFRNVALVFFAYSIVLGLVFYDLAKVTSFSRVYIFALVMVISLSTLAKYVGGLPNLTLIVADQKLYINNAVMMGTTIANTILVFVLVGWSGDLLWVKLGSSMVFLLRPIIYSVYVRRQYTLYKTKRAELEQKWTGVGQHIAYFLHTNTDVVLLTLFADIRLVAVYAVYSLVISSIRALTQSFSGSMEARFGELIAKGASVSLQHVFKQYQILLSSVTVTLFGCTGILVLSFVRLYTRGITDAEYIQPAFAMVLLLAEAINCLTLPSTSLPVAANHFRQTRGGAYLEAILNILFSLALIQWQPLLGVAIGTLVATMFRGIYYMFYSAKQIVFVPFRSQIIAFGIALIMLGLIIVVGNYLVQFVVINNYLQWILCALVAFVVLSVPCVIVVKTAFRSVRFE